MGSTDAVCRTLEASMYPSGRRVVHHRFQSGEEEEYLETSQTTILTPAAKKQGQGDTTILLQADRLPSILQVNILVPILFLVPGSHNQHLFQFTELSSDQCCGSKYI